MLGPSGHEDSFTRDHLPPPEAWPRIDLSGFDYPDWLNAGAELTCRMVERGYDPDFARRCFDQIKGFGEYGFPESHAYSFALLAYASAWLKCHEPAAFLAALLNSQPMGFYSPSQLVQDARRHGIEVRPVDLHRSHWESTLEVADIELGNTAQPAHPSRYGRLSKHSFCSIQICRKALPNSQPAQIQGFQRVRR